MFIKHTKWFIGAECLKRSCRAFWLIGPSWVKTNEVAQESSVQDGIETSKHRRGLIVIFWNDYRGAFMGKGMVFRGLKPVSYIGTIVLLTQ